MAKQSNNNRVWQHYELVVLFTRLAERHGRYKGQPRHEFADTVRLIAAELGRTENAVDVRVGWAVRNDEVIRAHFVTTYMQSKEIAYSQGFIGRDRMPQTLFAAYEPTPSQSLVEPNGTETGTTTFSKSVTSKRPRSKRSRRGQNKETQSFRKPDNGPTPHFIERCDAVKKFLDSYGRYPRGHKKTRDPDPPSKEEIRLGKWVLTQQSRANNGYLSKERQELCEELPGWDWQNPIAGRSIKEK